MDENGKPRLECTCGLVLTEKPDHNNPYLTKAGSFYTNNSYPLLELTPEEEPRFQPRNTCIHLGYGSVAIIPIRANETTIGTLQLNDKKTDAFTPQMINDFENICLTIGNALMRLKAEDEIRVSEEKLKEAQRITKVGSWERNVETREVRWSNEMYNIFGINREKYSPSLDLMVEFVHPDDKEMVLAVINRERATKILETIRFRILTPAGEVKHVESRRNPILNQEGETITLIGTVQDITEIVKLENEKNEIYARTMLTLETKVKERTNEINTQKKLHCCPTKIII